MSAAKYPFNPEYSIITCTQCLIPLGSTENAQKRHLYKHHVKDERQKTLLALFESYGPLRSLNAPPPQFAVPPPAIPNLRVYKLYQCRLCTRDKPSVCKKKIGQHISHFHRIKPKQQNGDQHWRRFSGQSFGTENKSRIYFEVQPVDSGRVRQSASRRDSRADRFFRKNQVRREREKQQKLQNPGVVQGFGEHKSEAIPWIADLGILRHLEGLPRKQVLASYQIPKRDIDYRLNILLQAFDKVFHRAYDQAQPGGPVAEISHASLIAVVTLGVSVDRRSSYYHPTVEHSTKIDYFRHWKQYVAYYFRMMIEFPRGGFWFPDNDQPADVQVPHLEFAPEEALIIQQILNAADMKPEEDAVEATVGVIPRLVMHMVATRTGPNVFNSALISFASMLIIKPSDMTWKFAGNYNHHMSALVWVSQLLMLDACVQKAKEDPDPSHTTNFYCIQTFDSFGRQHCETPLGQLLNWRDLLFKIAKDTMPVRDAIWNEGQTGLQFGKTTLQLEDVTRLLESEFTKARDVLYQELLLGSDSVLHIKPTMLKEDMHHTTPGESLVDFQESHIPQNSLECAIAESEPLCNMFLKEGRDGSLTWDEKAMDNYEASVQKFLGHMLVLIHVGSGQPLRSPEVLSIKWSNTHNQTRSIWVLHGQVMITCSYHKGLQQTGRVKNNLRFLPDAMGELLLDFLVHVQPLRREFLSASENGKTLSPFLFQKDCDVWSDEQVTRDLERACALARVPRLNVSTWRQITVAIVKAKFHRHSSYFDLNPGEDHDDRDDANPDVQAMNQQRNHATITANRSYANELSFGGIWDELTHRSRRASKLWGDLFEVDSTFELLRKCPSNATEADDEEDNPLLKRISQTLYKQPRSYMGKELVKTAREVLNTRQFSWRSPEQQTALEMTLTHPVVVAVLPTGGGKSLLFMVPCKLPGAKITILVVPLISLQLNMLARLKAAGIRSAVWSETTFHSSEIQLVVVSAEASCSQKFRAYAIELATVGRLDRIVVDECHLTVTASSYRKSMSQIGGLRHIETKFLYLTATLPPALEGRFLEQNFIVDVAKIVRASSDRPNIAYRCAHVIGKGPFLKQAAKQIVSYRGSAKVRCGKDKVMVYCQRVADVQEVARYLNCAEFYSTVGSHEDKDRIIRDWLEDPQQTYIVCTSALGAGFEYQFVRRVYHIDLPSSMVDFVQESGRAGRDGNAAVSQVILRPAVDDEETPNLAEEDKEAMWLYATVRSCLRNQISVFLDGPNTHITSCLAIEGAKQCRYCEAGSTITPGNGAMVEVDVIPQPDAGVLTGSDRIMIEAHQQAELLVFLRSEIVSFKGICVICKLNKQRFDHRSGACPASTKFNKKKTEHYNMRKKTGGWLKQFSCCYTCYLPQVICPRAIPDNPQEHCDYPDIVLPFCYAMWQRYPADFHQRFSRSFDIRDPTAFFDWIGKPIMLGDHEAIQANFVFLKLLQATSKHCSPR